MPIIKLRRNEVALELLRWALRLITEFGAYLPAITAVSAAEELLGKPLGERAAFHRARDEISNKTSIPPKLLADGYLNRGKNLLKHWIDDIGDEQVEIDTQTDAIQLSVRALVNAEAAELDVEELFREFLAWVVKNRPDLLKLDKPRNRTERRAVGSMTRKANGPKV